MSPFEVTIYVSYAIALLLWIVLSFLLIRHIQALTELRGIIKWSIVTYFIVSLCLIFFSLAALLGLHSVNPQEPISRPTENLF